MGDEAIMIYFFIPLFDGSIMMVSYAENKQIHGAFVLKDDFKN